MADNVFINGRAAIHKGSAGKSIAFPDVCLCPPSPPAGPVPTPLPNTAQAMDLQGGATTVTIEGNPVAHSMSFIAQSTGNEVAQATGGGVITHMVKGAAYFVTYSRNVFIEGKPAFVVLGPFCAFAVVRAAPTFLGMVLGTGSGGGGGGAAFALAAAAGYRAAGSTGSSGHSRRSTDDAIVRAKADRIMSGAGGAQASPSGLGGEPVDVANLRGE